MYKIKSKVYAERVKVLTEQALVAFDNLDTARGEYEAALIALGLGIQKMQWANTQERRARVEWSQKKYRRLKTYRMRKAS